MSISEHIPHQNTVLDATDNGGEREYAAKITGAHMVYELQRTLLVPSEGDGRHLRFYIFENGIYEHVEYSANGDKYRRFFRLGNGTVTDMTRPEVEAFFNARESLPACTCTSSCCDGDCYCLSDCYCRGGQVSWHC